MSEHSAPERYRYTAIPHVMVNDAQAAIRFYIAAFGAMELFRVAKPDGKVIHAELSIVESVVMVGDAEAPFQDPRSLGATSVGLHVYVPDVDALFARAVSAGARVLQPLQDMFYGDRTAMIEDPFGHIWVFLTHKEDVSPDEIRRRAEALFQ